ncbi:phosphotyrosine protein phosphatase [Candidatus Woesearchaeota archaeon]|nr:phosphotyrosine protein phosphatase [Candidatus Woesearchaeota archaeon]
MKVLFICNQNQNRSKTAEELFKDRFETKSAGLFNSKPVTAKQLSWADVIMVMEEEQRHELSKRFPTIYLQKRVLNLNVPDIYQYNHPQLIESLKSSMEDYLELF